MDLWPHQQTGLNELAEAIESGYRRICVTSPTGGGKTRMCMYRMINSGAPSIFYTYRKMLFDQVSDNFNDWSIDHGYRASGKRPNLSAPVQLAMVRSEYSAVFERERRQLFDADEVFVDECHNNSKGNALTLVDAHREENDSVIVGWTATPLGIDHAFDKLIIAGKNSELRACGSHVPAIHYGPDEPCQKWVGKIAVEGGECGINQKKRMQYCQRVFGSIIRNYFDLNPNQVPTLLFAPGVDESIWLAQEFEKVGIPSAHIDSTRCYLRGNIEKSTPEIRKEIEEECKRGNIKIVCNRFVLREGVDWPFIGHGIFATVFGSITSYLQAGGRLIRAHDSMDQVIVQDHGGNWWRYGSLNEDREWRLEYTDAIYVSERMANIRDKDEPEPINCPQCGGIRTAGTRCPHCGFDSKEIIRKRPVLQKDGSLRQMSNDRFRQRRYLSNSEQIAEEWKSRVWAHRKSKQESTQQRTFAQLDATFAADHNWQYAPRDLPMMPKRKIDWFMPISKVPLDMLNGEGK